MRPLWFTIAALASKRSAGRFIMSSSQQQVEGIWNGLRSNRDRIFLLDGGTGEELFQRGVPDDRKIWSATALVHSQYHTALADVHRSFLEAGSDAITTNSYGVVPGVGFSSEEIAEHVATAGRIARQVVDDYCQNIKSNNNNNNMNPKVVMGSLGPLLESYRPDKLMDPAEGTQVYEIMARALAPFVDVFLAETMSCVEESSQAIQAIGRLESAQNNDDNTKDQSKLSSSCHPMMVSYTLDSEGKLRNGESVISAVTRTLDLCQENNVHLLGVLFNCAEPEAITKALQAIHQDSKLQQVLSERGVVTGAYANRLTPVDPNWSLGESDAPQATRTDLDVKRYSTEFVSSWVTDLGAQVVGGCCGITPEYIAYINNSQLRKG